MFPGCSGSLRRARIRALLQPWLQQDFKMTLVLATTDLKWTQRRMGPRSPPPPNPGDKALLSLRTPLRNRHLVFPFHPIINHLVFPCEPSHLFTHLGISSHTIQSTPASSRLTSSVTAEPLEICIPSSLNLSNLALTPLRNLEQLSRPKHHRHIMPPIRSLTATKPIKTERTHEENQER